MTNISISDAADAEALFSALADQLARLGAEYEIVVVGGSALLALGLVERPTKDVDLLAIHGDGVLRSADPLPSLPSDWLNDGPGSSSVLSAVSTGPP